jgi:hypothetical protein
MKFFFPILFLAACSSNPPAQLTEKAKDLEIYAQKPTDCRVVGKVVGIDKMGSKELALNQAINQASNLKASGVFVNQEVPNGKVITVYATAYQCE